MKKFLAIIVILCLGWSSVLAQTMQVSGTVTGADDGQPLPGVSVVVKGSIQGTVTDVNGRYSINASADAILQFSFVGMTTQEIAVGGRQVIHVEMQADAQAIEEVIVVAYGTARKSSFTGSAVTVKSEDLEKRKVSNITKAIDGLAPGIQVTSGSGQPGSGSSVYIRGLGSINAANTPLYVLDGVPYDGNINAINPNDIETMTVLKDASAGALYGSRGANGVILITTKKGKSGVSEVNVKANFGISSRSIPRYETMNAKEFIESNFSAFYNRQIQNGVHPDQAGGNALYEMSQGSLRIFGSQEQYNPFNYPVYSDDPSKWLIDPRTGLIRGDAKLLWEDNWLDEVTRSDAYRQEYTVDVSGGLDKTQYLLSFGYLNDNGILATTDFKRYTGRTNIETKPADWMSIGMGANFARSQANSLGASGSATSNVWYSAQLMSSIYPVYQRNPATGDFLLDEFGKKMFDYGPNRPAGSSGNFNSIATLYDDKYTNSINNVSGRGHIDFGDTGWATGLKLSISLGFDYYENDGLTYYNPFFGNAANSNGRVTKSAGSVLSYTANQILSYKKALNDHHFDVMAAHEFYDYKYSYVSGQKTGFPFGGLYEPDAASTVTDINGYSDKYSIESFLGRLNYDFNDKYYLSASIRSDASSRFHKDYRWKSFWSVGANYRISKEDFMIDYSSWLDNLAIRASYGHQGNDNIVKSSGGRDYYPWQAMYDLGWANANESGALVTSIENRDLTWEKSSIFNVGFDASLWSSRLQIGLEWYRRETSDLLLNYPMPLSTGFDGFSRNSGSMLNSGIEMTVTGRIIKTQDLQWSATLMGSTLKNKVLKLTEDGKDIISGNRIIREGEPYYSYYVCRSAGVDPMTGNALYWADNNDDNEPYITSSSGNANASRYVAGSRFPTFFGALSTQLLYKGFDFSIAVNYSLGGKMIDGIYQAQLMNFYYASQAKHKDLLKAWKKPGDITDIPRYDIGAATVYSDNMLINASYLSFKNITLGYTFSSNIVNKIGIKALRIYGVADNLYVFTHLKGMDPQYSVTGGTDFVYTPTRIVSLGIDLKF